MKRRTFLAAALVALPFAATAEPLDYTTGLVKERLAAGEVVFLDFKAEWCSTCRAQERVINALREENPAYDESITFINVDWDEFGRSDLVKELNIPRRSTLVVLHGEDELGRNVAQTSQESIESLMNAALTAATS